MFKQATENKAQAAVFVAMDDKRYTRADLEDPSRPGYLKAELTPIEPQIWTAAAHFGLLTPSGKQMRYVEVKPDPREPRSEEAPADLRKRVETAQEALNDVRTQMDAALDQRVNAQVDQQRAAARQDADAFNRAVAREQGATEQQMILETEAIPLRRRVSDAEAALRRWIEGERIRRRG